MKSLFFFGITLAFTQYAQAGLFGDSDAEQCVKLVSSESQAELAKVYCKKEVNQEIGKLKIC